MTDKNGCQFCYVDYEIKIKLQPASIQLLLLYNAKQINFYSGKKHKKNFDIK